MTTRFWKIASKEAKLAQIDAAIELGMTSIQCAMNCGVKPVTLRAFASSNGRRFGHNNDYAKAKRAATLGYKKRTRLNARWGDDYDF